MRRPSNRVREPEVTALGVLLAVALAIPAAAEEPRPRSLEVDGVLGVWLPEPTFRALAADARRGRLLPDLLELDADLERESRALIAVLERRADVAEAALSDARISVVSLEASLSEERRRSAHWSRSPALWLAVGVAIAAGAMAAIGAVR